MMMLRKVSVPKERLAILIGRRGTVKKELEERTQTRIGIDEEVTIEGEVGVLDAENIVLAIGRGFAPEQAMHLLDEEKTLCIIQLPKNKKSLSRIRARIIGKGGRSRKNIERLTRTDIVVYGKTVSIIGRYENAGCARDAVERLIRGDRHATVYRNLEDLNARGKIC